MRHRGFLVSIILALGVLFAQVAQSSETLKFTTGDWPPYMAKNMESYGVTSRIITEAFTYKNIKVEYDFYPWPRAYDLAYERYHVWRGTSAWLYTPERAEQFYYSEPLIETKQVLFHRKDIDLEWKSFEDLMDYTFGATLRYSYGPVFNSAEKDEKIKVERVPSDLLNYKKLLKGHIQIFPNEINVGFHTLQNNFSKEEFDQLTYHPRAINIEPVYLLFSKKDPRNKELVRLFNEGLKQLQESGRYNQILKEMNMERHVTDGKRKIFQ